MDNPKKFTPALPEPNEQLVPSAPSYVIPLETSDEGTWSPHQFLAMLRRRAILVTAITISVASVTWFISRNQKAEYESGFQLLVEPVTADQDALNEVTGDSSKGQGKQSSGLDYPTQIQVLRSPRLMQPILKKIQTRYRDANYGTLNAQLTISRPDDTKIIEVRYKDTDPEKVGFILKNIAQGYLRYSQQERQTNLRQGIGFVNEQINKTQSRVNSLQQQLQVFRQKNNFIDPSSQSNQISNQVNALGQQRLDTEKQLAETQQQYNNLQGQSGAVAALAGDAAYQKLLDKLREIEAKVATESSRLQEDTPEVDALKEQRDSLLPILRQEARRVLGNRLAEVGNQLSVLTTRQQAIQQTQRFWDQEIQRLPVTTRLFTDLQRELTVATESLNRFLQTRETLQVKAAQQEVPWQLIAPPEMPQTPADTGQRTLILGAIAGLLLGMVTALLAERLDSTFRVPSDIKKQTKLPLLGVIPLNANLANRIDLSSQPLKARGNSANAYAKFPEAFRALHTNLRLISATQPIRSVVISSATSDEGKSTVAIHLAIAAAQMGQRVLLIDADLHNPEISARLSLDNSHGLTDLVAPDLNPQRMVQQLESPTMINASLPDQSGRVGAIDKSDLFVLTAGQQPLDPARFLSSNRMHQLGEYFQAMYDLVIYDAPPLLSMADASLLSAHADGMILVSSLGKTTRSEFMQVLDGLQTARVRVYGVVANRDTVGSSDS